MDPRNRAAVMPHDPSDDDLTEYSSTKSAQSEHGQNIVAPSIQVRPEFSSLTRENDTNQPLTCVVVIELPGRHVSGDVPGPIIPENHGKPRSQHSSSGPSSPQSDNVFCHCKIHGLDEGFQKQWQISDTRCASTSNGPQIHEYDLNTLMHSKEDSPLHAITGDLRTRWQGHFLSDLGALQMYNLLTIRQESALSKLHVYLFKEVIICVGEKELNIPSRATSSKGVFRLKKTIYVGHIKSVIASSDDREMSLTIDVDEELASFILIFEDRSLLESWKNNIQALVSLYHAQNRVMQPQDVPLREDDELSNYGDPPTNLVTLHTSSEPSNSLSPLPHSQMDLVLVISVPPPNSAPSTAQLKIRVIRAMLGFLVASLGPKDRLSVVTFEVGMGGNLRKTPFLLVGRPHSRVRLEKFIDETGVKLDENKDEFLVRGSKEDKTDVITAVNHGNYNVPGNRNGQC